MFWIGVVSSVLAVVAVTVSVVFTKKRGADLGAVSTHWITEHRLDS